MRSVQEILADKQAKIASLLTRKNLGINLPQSLIAEDGNGVLLALTGKDFRALDFGAVAATGKRIGSILALDDEAATLAHICGLPIEFVEDILGVEATRKVQLSGREIASEWYKPFEDLLTVDGIVWPQLDRPCLFWFWLEVTTGMAIAKASHAARRELMVICRTPYVAPIYTYGEDNFGRGAIAAGLPSVFSLEVPATRRAPARVQLPWGEGLNNVAGSIVCVLNKEEIDRSKEVLRELSMKYPGKVCVCSLGYYSGSVDFVPIYPTPLPNGVANDGFFASFIGKLAPYDLPFDVALLPLVQRALRQYCYVRWPSFRSACRSFYQLFERHRPICVLGTDLEDAESQLAFCAARQLNIPTAAWGHAFINTFQSWNPHFAENVMVPTGYGLRAAKAAGVPANRYVAVCDIDRHSLYSTAEETWPARRHHAELRVLVLPIARRIGGTSIVMGSMRTQIAEIRDLCCIPEDLQSKICLRFKHHPAFKDDSPFVLNNLNRDEWCFSNKATLVPLLEECDCCILLSESGCAVLEASSRVPTLLITEDRLTFFDRGAHEAISEFPHQSEVITAVWELVRALQEKPNLRAEMLARQRSWVAPAPNARHWLDIVDDLCNVQLP